MRDGWPFVSWKKVGHFSVIYTKPKVVRIPCGEYQTLGNVLNVCFFAAITISSIVVVERSLRAWSVQWHISLASLVWVISIVGVSLAILRQDYWRVVQRFFMWARISPAGPVFDLPSYAVAPICFSIGCFLYLVASTLGKVVKLLCDRLRRDEPIKGD